MRSFYQIIISITILFSTACSFEEANLFPESAAVRLENTKTEYNKVLCSATNGWVMEYFPTDTTRGFNVLVKFHSSGEVDIATNNEFTKNVFMKDTSVFEMIADNGPVLSFNSYNPLFHIFSNPEDPKGTDLLNGLGMTGDYEFIVLKVDTNEIKLKGKKRGTYIYLKRLPDDQLWTDYYAKTDAMNTLLFNKGSNVLNFVFDTDTLLAYNGATHQFKITEKPGNVKQDDEFHSFIVTPSGIRFHTPFIHNEKQAQTFILNADNSALICSESPEAKLVASDATTNLNSYFNDNIYVWTFDPTKLSTKVKTNYDLLVQSLVTKYKATEIKVAIKYNATRKSHTLMIYFVSNKNKVEGNVDFKFSLLGKDIISMSYLGTGDSNGKSFYTNFSGYKEMVGLISNGFIITADAPINPQTVKFTNIMDADNWFTVTTTL